MNFTAIRIRLFFVGVFIVVAMGPIFVFGQSAPSITQQPQSQTVLQSSNTTFSVVASGQTPLSYQWSLNGTNLVDGVRISGATGASLNISNVVVSDVGSYRCVVTNRHGAVTSSAATLTVLVPAAITSQPTSQSVVVGSSAAFSAGATGTAPLNFRWYFNGAALSGATTANLSITNAQPNDAGTYQLVVSNSYGLDTSSAVTLTVFVPPSISTQPTNQTVPLRTNVTLTASATGAPAPQYQWYFNGVAMSDDLHHSGAASNALQIANVQTNDAGTYFVVASNIAGSATSAVATVSVTLPVPVIITPPADQHVLPGASAAFSVTVVGDEPFGYSWLFNGAALPINTRFSGTTTNKLTIRNVQAGDVGEYQVVVTNVWGAVTSSVAALNLATIRYVNVNNPAPGAPYTNWATAATTIQDAIDAASDGDHIVVTNGIYQTGGRVVYGALPNRVAITKAVTVRSVNGSSVTTIKGSPLGSGAVRCVYMTNGANLIGFTLANGSTSNSGDAIRERFGGGVYCESTDAFIQNCVLTGNKAFNNAGGAWRGTFDNCTFSGNNASTGGGGACEQSVLTNCMLVGNFANTAGGAYTSTLNNCQLINNYTVSGSATASGGGALNCQMTGCVLLGNSAVDSAGGAWAGTLINCLIISNHANYYGGALGATLYNCTVVGNYASYATGSVGGLSYGAAYNSIIVNNAGNYNGTTLSNCCTYPDPGSGGNITNDPVFVDYANNNLRLQSNSPCINVGANEFVSVAMDYDGAPRVVGATVDIGAFEYQHDSWIVTQPSDQNVVVTSNATFTVYSLGESLTYQWQVNGTNLNNDGHFIGADTASLTVSNAQASDVGAYQVIVSNGGGSVTSAVATLTVLFPPMITSQPDSTSAVVGGVATFSTVVSGTAPFTYQWYSNSTALVNGGRVAGAASANLTISNLQTNDGASYSVIVTNNYGSVSSAVATLSVYPPAQIVTQPVSRAVLIGSNVSFNVTATGLSPTYRWLFNGSPLTDGGRITGATTPSLSVSSVETGDAGGYRVVVTDVANVVTSRVASLTVLSSNGPSVRYVSLTSTNPVVPFLSWSTAATNIQDAVDAAVDGDLVLVSNGVYQVGGRVVYGVATNRVTVDKAVVVQSVNGPAVTMIRGAATPTTPSIYGRCVYLTNGAALLGFTITNGGTAIRRNGDIREENGGGVWCESSSAIISNCVLVGNTAYQGGGGVFRGTLVDSIVTNNTASMGGGVCSNVAVNCFLTKNRSSFQNLTSGGGAIYSVLSNCVLMANTALGGGGGAAYSTLNSCVVSNNVGNSAGGGVCVGQVNYSLISSNRSFNGGGCYSNVLNNCVLKNNLASGNGGGACFSTLLNCTVVSNFNVAGSGAYAGIYGGAASNSIVYYNTGAKGTNFLESMPMYYCCALPLATNGIGNITNAPQLVDLVAGDLRLSPSSPCINAGNNSYVTSTTDFAGNARVVGGTVDIGAYEFQSPGSIISYAWLADHGIATDGSADFIDSDGDGLNNWQEWRAGTDPNVSSSTLQLLGASNAPNGVTITWQSVTGVTYFVQRATDLSGNSPFATLQSNVAGQSGTTSFTDVSATNASTYFYRVGVQ